MSDYGTPFFDDDWPLENGEELVIPAIGEQVPKPPVINDKRRGGKAKTPPPEAPKPDPTPEVIGKRRYENVYTTLHAKWDVPADIVDTHNNVYALSNLIEAELAAVLTRHLGAVNGFELILQMDLR